MSKSQSGRTLRDLVTDLDYLKRHKKKLEAELTDTNKEIQRLEFGEIPERFEQMGDDLDQKVPFDGLGTVSLKTRVMPHVPAAKREDFHDWLRNNGMGEIVTEGVHPKTLAATINERMENGRPLPPEDVCKVTVRNVAHFTPARKKS